MTPAWLDPYGSMNCCRGQRILLLLVGHRMLVSHIICHDCADTKARAFMRHGQKLVWLGERPAEVESGGSHRMPARVFVRGAVVRQKDDALVAFRAALQGGRD